MISRSRRSAGRYGIAAAVAALACGAPAIPDVPAASGRATERAAATITPEDLYARIAFLADDALGGRATPSPGLEVAAAYLASEFLRMGLQPAGDGTGYLQRYPVVVRGSNGGTTHHAPNVVAVLPGSDSVLRNTYIVFSAHFDHVGIGRPDAYGDSIYNGADDDASGTAAIMEIAEAFASLPVPPARSLVFLAVSGEERGLLGSRHFADHPTVPADAIVANINLDMIGRNAPDSIVAIGQQFSSLGPLVQEVARRRPELGLTVADDLWPEENFFFRSDHFSFARLEIPAIFFFAGVHEDYHRPSDHVDDIDTDKTARVARLVFWLGHAIATEPMPPSWSAEGLARVRELTR